MNKIIRTSLLLGILLALSACNLGGTPNPSVFENSVLRLNVQIQNNVTTFSQPDETINIQYVITNSGTARLAGPVVVTDPPRQVTCPALNTVGNQDIYLDPNETVTCTAAYKVTQSDVTTGSITIVASATAGTLSSNQVRLTLTRAVPQQPSPTLKLTKTASSQTYGAAGQSITYTYVITNTAATPLGPAQFTISDNKLGAPFNCGPANTTLASNQSVNCSMPYTVTAADMAVANIVNTATATGAAQTSAPATVTVTNLTFPTAVPATAATTAVPSNPNLTPGSTQQHPVSVGEWLIQIVRCYGADLDEVIAANPQIKDPDLIYPAPVTTVTVPRIGSRGKIYGPPCITWHNVQSGDTWTSIAQRYNADLAVLQRVNPAGLTPGRTIKIPLNSAGGTGAVVTPIVPTTVTPPITAVAPMRITFDPNSTTASRIGVINPNETLQYIVAAQAGQVMTIQLTAPANEVAIGVTGPTALALKPLDPSPTWSATISTSGDHIITLASVLGTSSKSYTLQVSLTGPNTPVPPTPTITPTPLTPVSQSNAHPNRGEAS